MAGAFVLKTTCSNRIYFRERSEKTSISKTFENRKDATY